VQRSYRAKKSCFEIAGGVLACAPPLTILAHEGVSLGRGALPGREWASPILSARPATPAGEGEAGWWGGSRSSPMPGLHGASSTP
jgi:hypothetical protein